MIPEKYAGKLNNGDSFYSLPIVKIDGEAYKILFDFRLLKSIHITDPTSGPYFKLGPYFRLRGELSASILSRFSSHASRIGITSIE